MTRAKRILIPTDFSVHSLQLVVEVIDNHTADKVEVVLVYGRHQSSSITEIFANSKDDLLEDLQSEDFIDACQVIRNCYKSKLTELYADIMQSDNQNYVKNYLMGMRADDIIIPTTIDFEYSDKKAFDVRPCLEKAGDASKITPVDYGASVQNCRSKHDIISLFFREKLDVTFQ